MSEQSVDTSAEVVENAEKPEVTVAGEKSPALSLADVHSADDSELDALLFKEFTNSSVDNDDEDTVEVHASLDKEELDDSEELAEEVELDAPKEVDASEGEEEEEDLEEEEAVDYKAFHEEFFAPFKANGKQYTVDNMAEARTLIQKGLGYHKNMEELKPFKKAMNVLKSRGGLSPERLDFLLDIAEGKPEALAKHIKDLEIDPYDINVDDGEQYVSQYKDTEAVDQFNEILDSLAPGDAKVATLEILSSKGWDQSSKNMLYTNPQNILELNRQIQDGTYSKITTVLDKKRALGELVGVDDLEAYNRVGTELQNQGKLGVPSKPNESTNTSKPAKQVSKTVTDNRKKAGGAPRSAPSNVPTAEKFTPATATEEELDKFLEDHLRRSAG